MRLVLQRVSKASVSWQDEDAVDHCNSIAAGLAILLGAGPHDTAVDAGHLADKIATLRIFPDAEGRFDRSLEDVGGEALVVSQFTLFANATRGRRPSFLGAAPPALATALCDRFSDRLRQRGIATQTGSFGAHMTVSLDNDGPVTVVLSTDPWDTRIRG
ncbi:MAG: D-aminoacyl-tRNA deacylase [Candidatus Dormibacteraeota bacterium]|nr:D-aminoacyl-tRNA deacylase [Candidatus Dormibacteraeota bacterium]